MLHLQDRESFVRTVGKCFFIGTLVNWNEHFQSSSIIIEENAKLNIFLRFPEVIQLNVNPTLVWLCISYIKTGETAYFIVTLRWFKSTLKHFWHLKISSMSRWLKHRKQNIWSLYSIRLSIWIAPNNLLSYLKRISKSTQHFIVRFTS